MLSFIFGSLFLFFVSYFFFLFSFFVFCFFGSLLLFFASFFFVFCFLGSFLLRLFIFLPSAHTAGFGSISFWCRISDHFRRSCCRRVNASRGSRRFPANGTVEAVCSYGLQRGRVQRSMVSKPRDHFVVWKVAMPWFIVVVLCNCNIIVM